MTLPVFPGPHLLPGLTYGSKWTPQFFSQTATGAAGADVDVSIAQYPLHDFELEYEILRDGLCWGGPLVGLEFRTMLGFFMMMRGPVGRCLYLNPDDHTVFQNKIGIGDGVTTTFTLTRTFGANGYFATEPVGMVNTGELFNVYLAGSSSPVLPTLYALSTANPVANTVTFATAPALGQAVAVDMSYWYYCKLGADSQTFEKFMDRIWSSSVKLHSCRPGT